LPIRTDIILESKLSCTTNKKMADTKNQNAGKASPSKGKKKGAKAATDESLGPLLTEKQQGIERYTPSGKFAL
jgi:hypothetical protein